MFRFSMDVRDASISNEQRWFRYGVKEDNAFQWKMWSKFHRLHPSFDPQDPESEGFDEADLLSQEIFFRIDGNTPRNNKEALQIVRDIFFFSPLRVWLGEEEYQVNKNIKEQQPQPTIG